MPYCNLRLINVNANLANYCFVIQVSFYAPYNVTECTVSPSPLGLMLNTKCRHTAVVIHLAYQSQLCV